MKAFDTAAKTLETLTKTLETPAITVATLTIKREARALTLDAGEVCNRIVRNTYNGTNISESEHPLDARSRAFALLDRVAGSSYH